MKLFIAAAVILLTASPATAASAVHTLDVSPQKGIHYDILEVPSGCGAGGARGSAHLSQDFANELLENAGLSPVSPSEGTVVQTRFLTEDLHPHVDHKVETGLPVSEGSSVAFIAVNDNENAFFVHGDERLPIVKDQMYHFDGSVEHGVIVNGGNVQLLGPFDMPLFGMVGGCSTCSELSPEDCCVDHDDSTVPCCKICVKSSDEGIRRRLSKSGTKAPKGSKSAEGGDVDVETCNPMAECVPTSAPTPSPGQCYTCPAPTPVR